MKTLKPTLFIALVLLLTGCGNNQPAFNSKNKGIKFVNANPYVIPYQTNSGLYEEKIKQQFERMAQNSFVGSTKKYNVTKEQMHLIKTSHIGAKEALLKCKLNNDLLWFSSKHMNKKATSLLIAQGFINGTAGCAKPLSKEEYQHYLMRQQKAMANMQQQRQYQQQQQAAFNSSMQQFNNNIQQQNNQLMTFMSTQNSSQNYSDTAKKDSQHMWVRDMDGNMHHLYQY